MKNGCAIEIAMPLSKTYTMKKEIHPKDIRNTYLRSYQLDQVCILSWFVCT